MVHMPVLMASCSPVTQMPPQRGPSTATPRSRYRVRRTPPSSCRCASRVADHRTARYDTTTVHVPPAQPSAANDAGKESRNGAPTVATR